MVNAQQHFFKAALCGLAVALCVLFSSHAFACSMAPAPGVTKEQFEEGIKQTYVKLEAQCAQSGGTWYKDGALKKINEDDAKKRDAVLGQDPQLPVNAIYGRALDPRDPKDIAFRENAEKEYTAAYEAYAKQSQDLRIKRLLYPGRFDSCYDRWSKKAQKSTISSCFQQQCECPESQCVNGETGKCEPYAAWEAEYIRKQNEYNKSRSQSK